MSTGIAQRQISTQSNAYYAAPIEVFDTGPINKTRPVAAFYFGQYTVTLSNYPRFRKLADQWLVDTENSSSLTEIITHPAYMQIMGMGPSVIPYLLNEIEREPNHWFAALRAVTGADPVRPESAGDLDEMTSDWLEWASENGYR